MHDFFSAICNVCSVLSTDLNFFSYLPGENHPVNPHSDLCSKAWLHVNKCDHFSGCMIHLGIEGVLLRNTFFVQLFEMYGLKHNGVCCYMKIIK